MKFICLMRKKEVYLTQAVNKLSPSFLILSQFVCNAAYIFNFFNVIPFKQLPKMLEICAGGTFALYSLLCRHAKLSLLPNQQAADEELSTYYGNGNTTRHVISSPLKRFLEKHKRLRTCLLLIVLFGACMVIGDGVLTPAISGKSRYFFLQSVPFCMYLHGSIGYDLAYSMQNHYIICLYIN